MKIKIMFLPLLIGFGSTAQAFESGAGFLKIGSDARAVSMGSAYTALASGVSAMSYNISGLSRAKGVEVGLSHSNWLMDSKHDFVGVAIPIKFGGLPPGSYVNSGWFVGLGFTRLSNSSTEVRNSDRSVGGSFAAYDQAVSLGVAKAIGKNHLGFGIKYLESYMAGEKAHGAALDLGCSRVINTRLPITVGLSVQNLGAGMKYLRQRDQLPLSFAAGFSISVIPGISLAVDAKRMVYDNQTAISFGTEYAVFPGAALRSGYLGKTRISGSGNKGFSLGGGLKFWNTQMDYAVMPYTDLGNTQRITLKKQF